VLGIAGAVLATAAAGFVFTWLRRRSGSLIAPIALHWSLKGAGALAAARREVHLNLRQANYDLARFQFNTVASAAMKMLNAIDDAKLPEDDAVRAASAAVTREALSVLIRVLYPAVPHIAHVLWTELGYVAELGDILDAPWPVVDPAALEQDEIELVVTVNGKLRGAITVPKAADKAAIEAAALADANVRKFVDGQTVKKVIVVPGKLVNVVV